jgi:predicted transcriptional regulator
MQEIVSNDPELESNETTQAYQTSEINVVEIIAKLKNMKIEEQDLLAQRKKLQETENELRNQAMTEIEEKHKRLDGLKSEISYLQKKCSELEQALGIPVYE